MCTSFDVSDERLGISSTSASSALVLDAQQSRNDWVYVYYNFLILSAVGFPMFPLRLAIPHSAPRLLPQPPLLMSYSTTPMLHMPPHHPRRHDRVTAPPSITRKNKPAKTNDSAGIRTRVRRIVHVKDGKRL
jgi:hypothetical protein